MNSYLYVEVKDCLWPVVYSVPSSRERPTVHVVYLYPYPHSAHDLVLLLARYETTQLRTQKMADRAQKIPFSVSSLSHSEMQAENAIVRGADRFSSVASQVLFEMTEAEFASRKKTWR